MSSFFFNNPLFCLLKLLLMGVLKILPSLAIFLHFTQRKVNLFQISLLLKIWTKILIWTWVRYCIFDCSLVSCTNVICCNGRYHLLKFVESLPSTSLVENIIKTAFLETNQYFHHFEGINHVLIIFKAPSLLILEKLHTWYFYIRIFI